MSMGASDNIFFVHCGSLSEPYETLKDLHSKFAQPIGKKIPNLIAGTSYENAEFDAVIDEWKHGRLT